MTHTDQHLHLILHSSTHSTPQTHCSHHIVQIGATTYIKHTDAKKAVYFYVKGRENEKKHRWKQFFDPNRNKYYYSNLETKKTVWFLPDVEKDESKAKEQPPAAAAATAPKEEAAKKVEQQTTENTNTTTPTATTTNTTTNNNNKVEEVVESQKVVDNTTVAAAEKTTVEPAKEEEAKKAEQPTDKTNTTPTTQTATTATTNTNNNKVEETESKKVEDSTTTAAEKTPVEPVRIDEELDSKPKGTIWGYMAGRKSFSASFAESGNTSADTFDAFDDFDRTSTSQTKTSTGGDEPEEENTPPFSGTLTRSNAMVDQPSTVEPIKFSKKDLVPGRGKIETYMEEDLFRGVGLGEVRVLCAIKGYYLKKGHAKKEVAIGIVRDYSGAFGLFFANYNTQKKGKKFCSIAFDIPMLHFYEMSTVLADKDIVRFHLVIDGSEFDILTHIVLRDKLWRGLEFVYKLIRAKKGQELCLYRMSAIDFAMTYTVQRPSHTRESLLMELVALIQRTKTPEEPNTDLDELFQDLRILLRNGDDREWIIEQLYSFTRSRDFKSRHVVICAQILDAILKTPSAVGNFQVERAEYQRHMIRNMIHVWSKLKVLDEQLVQDLIEEVEDTFVIMRNVWESRGNLPDVKFSDDFFLSDQEDAKEQFTLERLKSMHETKLKESLSSKSLEPGVYLASIFYTPNGEILSDMKDNLPCVPLTNLHYSEVIDFNVDSGDRNMEWMIRYGLANFSQTLSEIEMTQNIRRKKLDADALNRNTVSELNESKELFPYSRFRREMAKACLEMTTIFNIDSIGTLFDKPVKLHESRTVLFLTVKKLEDKSSITVTSSYKWTNNFEFEHQLYQKYENLPELLPMDRLRDDYHGSRWLTCAVHTDRYIRHKPRTGLYLGLMCYSLGIGGYEVLVTDDRRFMMPSSFVGPSLPTEEQWIWIQSLKAKIAEGNLFGDNEDAEKIGAFTPDYELLQITSIPPFQLLFYRSLLKLMNELQLSSMQELGTLYDLELITLDETDKTKMILFVTRVPPQSKSKWVTVPQDAPDQKLNEEEDESNNKKKKNEKRRKNKKGIPKKTKPQFLWRKGDLFELVMFQVFRPTTYQSFMNTFREELSCENWWINNSKGFVTDEAIRFKIKETDYQTIVDEKDLLSYIRKEESWLSVRWPLRVVHWMNNLAGASIVDLSTTLLRTIRMNEEEREKKTAMLQNKENVKEAITEANALFFSCNKIQMIDSVISEEVRKKGSSTLKSVDNVDWGLIEKKIAELTKLEIVEELPEKEEEVELVDNSPFLKDDEDLEKIVCCIYDVDVNIEEIKDIETLKLHPTKDEITDIMTQEMFEKTFIRSMDEYELKLVSDVMNEMVDILEVSDELQHLTVMEDRTQECLQILNRERIRYQKNILDVYDRVLQEDMLPYDHERISKRASDRDMISVIHEQFNEWDMSYDEVVRKMILRFSDTMEYSKDLFRVINSALETVELTESMYLYERSLENRESLTEMIDEQYNQVPRDGLGMIGVTRRERQFLTSNGSTTREPRHHSSDNNDLSFCNLEETEEEIMMEQERIKHIIEQQTEIEMEREKLSRSAMKSSLARSPFGYQGFSLPRSIPDSTRKQQQQQQQPESKRSPSPSPMSPYLMSRSKSRTPQRRNASPSPMSPSTPSYSPGVNTTDKSPTASSEKKRRDNWFGYKPPESMSLTVRQQLEEIRESREKHLSERKKQGFYNEQNKAILNLNQLMDMYGTLKVKSSNFLSEDPQQLKHFRKPLKVSAVTVAATPPMASARGLSPQSHHRISTPQTQKFRSSVINMPELMSSTVVRSRPRSTSVTSVASSVHSSRPTK